MLKIPEKKIQEAVEKISQSEVFKNAPQYQALLRYLVKSTLQGVMPKEFHIASEVFGKKTDFDSTHDSSVRSTVYNLRRKLDKYYQSEGRYDEIRLRIPKGHYQVIFETSEQVQGRGRMTVGAGLILLTGLIIGWGIARIDSPETKHPLSDCAIWKPMMTESRNPLLVLGDHFFYVAEFPAGNPVNIRDTKINSEEDLDDFLNFYPDLSPSVMRTEHTYLTKRIPWCMAEFSHLLTRDPELKLSSEFNWEDSKGHALIFVGSYRNLGLLSSIMEDLPFLYDNEKHQLICTSEDSVSTTYYFFGGHQETCHINNTDALIDYALVMCYPAPDGYPMLLFISMHDIGTLAATAYFTDPDSCHAFNRDYLEYFQSPWFAALFKVQGYSRTDMKNELLMVREITVE